MPEGTLRSEGGSEIGRQLGRAAIRRGASPVRIDSAHLACRLDPTALAGSTFAALAGSTPLPSSSKTKLGWA